MGTLYSSAGHQYGVKVQKSITYRMKEYKESTLNVKMIITSTSN